MQAEGRRRVRHGNDRARASGAGVVAFIDLRHRAGWIGGDRANRCVVSGSGVRADRDVERGRGGGIDAATGELDGARVVDGAEAIAARGGTKGKARRQHEVHGHTGGVGRADVVHRDGVIKVRTRVRRCWRGDGGGEVGIGCHSNRRESNATEAVVCARICQHREVSGHFAQRSAKACRVRDFE